MEEKTDSFQSKCYDVLIIGGGISGIAALRKLY